MFARKIGMMTKLSSRALRICMPRELSLENPGDLLDMMLIVSAGLH